MKGKNKKNMKKIQYIFFAAALLLSTLNSYAQQEPKFTHYMYNTLSFNPAYAGSRDAMSILGLGRFQWVGLDGAPITQTFQVHSPIVKGLNMGLSFVNDKIGPTSNSNLNIDLAYRFNLGKGHRLSIGIKGGVDFLENRLSSLIIDQPNDPLFSQNVSLTLPNAGIGIYYDHTNFYAGFSIPKLVEHRINGGNADLKRHYYFIVGGYIPVSKTIDLKPTALVKVVAGSPVQIDGTLEMIFVKKVSIGAFYRSLDGVGAILGYNILPNFRIGYSFDWPLTEISRAGQYGSHEVMFRYDLRFTKTNKIVSPRYF